MEATEAQIQGDPNLIKLYGDNLGGVIDAVSRGDIVAEIAEVSTGEGKKRHSRSLVILKAASDGAFQILAGEHADRLIHFNYGYGLFLRRRVSAGLKLENKSSEEVLESQIKGLLKMGFSNEQSEAIAVKSPTYREALVREEGRGATESTAVGAGDGSTHDDSDVDEDSDVDDSVDEEG